MSEKAETAEIADVDSLSPEEMAYFESGGEGPIEQDEEQRGSDASEEDAGNAKANDDSAEGKQGQQKDEKGRYVPHQALHAEREEHKKTRAELQELKEFRARMEERWRLFEQAQQAQKGGGEEQEEAPPDPNEDIFAFSRWQAKQLEKLNAKVAQREQQERQYQEQAQQEQQIWGLWQSDAQRYAKENPDFPNAAKWLAETRDRQLQALSIANPHFSDPRARSAQIDAELKQIVVAAAQRGMSPSEAVYEIALSYGYTRQEAEAAAKGADNEVAEKLQRLEKAQTASKTVGKASGRSGGDEITPETLAAMSEEDFSRWLSVPENARRFERMMGA